MKGVILCDHANLKETSLMCKKYGYGIEAQSFYDPDYLENNPDGISLHLDELNHIDLRSIHGPFWDLCPGSFDKKIREVTRDRFQYAYDCAKKINAKHMVIHHGGYVSGVYTYQKSLDDWTTRCIDFWIDFLKNKDDVNIYIENFLEPDPESMLKVVEAVNKDNFRVNLDIGHVNYSSELSVVEWIKRLNKYIGYVHIQDNIGTADEHMRLGTGNLPLDEIFKALEEYSPEALWAVELKTEDMIASVEWMIERGYIRSGVNCGA